VGGAGIKATGSWAEQFYQKHLITPTLEEELEKLLFYDIPPNLLYPAGSIATKTLQKIIPLPEGTLYAYLEHKKELTPAILNALGPKKWSFAPLPPPSTEAIKISCIRFKTQNLTLSWEDLHQHQLTKALLSPPLPESPTLRLIPEDLYCQEFNLCISNTPAHAACAYLGYQDQTFQPNEDSLWILAEGRWKQILLTTEQPIANLIPPSTPLLHIIKNQNSLVECHYYDPIRLAPKRIQLVAPNQQGEKQSTALLSPLQGLSLVKVVSHTHALCRLNEEEAYITKGQALLYYPSEKKWKIFAPKTWPHPSLSSNLPLLIIDEISYIGNLHLVEGHGYDSSHHLRFKIRISNNLLTSSQNLEIIPDLTP
jgi:hypothetical protein